MRSWLTVKQELTTGQCQPYKRADLRISAEACQTYITTKGVVKELLADERFSPQNKM